MAVRERWGNFRNRYITSAILSSNFRWKIHRIQSTITCLTYNGKRKVCFFKWVFSMFVGVLLILLFCIFLLLIFHAILLSTYICTFWTIQEVSQWFCIWDVIMVNKFCQSFSFLALCMGLFQTFWNKIMNFQLLNWNYFWRTALASLGLLITSQRTCKI